MAKSGVSWICGRLVLTAIALVAILPAPSVATEDFTLVLLPDTQYESEYHPSWYTAQTQWIRDNRDTLNVKYVIHMGDIVDNYNSTAQWQAADAAQSILEGANPIPHSVMPGNHDMTGSGSPDYTRNASYYNAYFPRSRYAGQSWFGGTYGSTNENNYGYFSVGDLDFLVLSLEPLPRDDVLTWANGVVQAHPDHRVIMASHIMLNPDGQRRIESTYGYLQGNDGQDVYDKLIYNNPNIFMATCGHIAYEAMIPTKNAAGNQVYELLSDYQRTDHGNGWLRTLHFSPDNNRITVRSYSPTLDQWDNYGAFALEYDMGGTITPPAARPLATMVSRWTFDTDGADWLGANDLGLGTTSTIGTGRFGGGLDFDGEINDWGVASVSEPLAITDAFSAATWVKFDYANPKLARIFSIMEDDDNGCNLGFLDGNATSSSLVLRVVKDGVSYHVATDQKISRNVFHHVAFAFDDLAGSTAGTKITMWIDGDEAAISEANHFDGVRGFNGYLVAGRLDGSVVDTKYPFPEEIFFSGMLDDMRWYDGVLSDDQVTAMQYLPVPGDANGDGTVDDADAAIVADNWGESDANWTMGDFNGDGTVDMKDSSILAANWGTSVVESAPVPEPSLAIMLSLGALACLMRRGRNAT